MSAQLTRTQNQPTVTRHKSLSIFKAAKPTLTGSADGRVDGGDAVSSEATSTYFIIEMELEAVPEYVELFCFG